jgi:hypothetical protein
MPAGSWGASQGANSASSTKNATRKSPVAASQLFLMIAIIAMIASIAGVCSFGNWVI